MKDIPSPVPLVFTQAQDVENESDLEKLEEDLDNESVNSPLPEKPTVGSCLNCDAEMTPDHQCETLDSESNWEDVESEAEQKFCEFRMRWIGRLDKCTDDWALKTKLLESLEDAYLAPVTVLSNGDFDDVKDKFFQGDLSPARFLDELQRLLSRN